jgi:Tfp pilus assembly protein FimT
MTTTQTTSNRRGFTFTEILMVGTIASILLSGFLGSFSGTMDELAVGNAADAFVGANQRARALAVHYGRTAQLHIDENRIWIEVDTTRARTGERTILGDVIDLTETDVQIDATASLLCFDSRGATQSRGACAGSSATFSFAKGENVRTVKTMATGYIQQ